MGEASTTCQLIDYVSPLSLISSLFRFSVFVDECNFESVSTVVTIWYCLFVVVILSCNYVSVVVCNIVTVR